MKLKLITPTRSAPRTPAPEPLQGATVVIPDPLERVEILPRRLPSEMISPRLGFTRVTVPALDSVGRSAIMSGIAMAKGALGRNPVIICPHYEHKDDFRRVYAMAQNETALSVAVALLGAHAARMETQGVRLCLYMAGTAELKSAIVADKGQTFAWQACGKNMFLVYPRNANLTAEWAVWVYKTIKALAEVHEAGITIEFPNE